LGFGLTRKDFSIRISDRELWFKFLESEKIPAEKISAVLAVVDKLERLKSADIIEALKTVLAGTSLDASKLLTAVQSFAAIRSLKDLEFFAQKNSLFFCSN
jgi:histidyl-tRNA synthetase